MKVVRKKERNERIEKGKDEDDETECITMV